MLKKSSGRGLLRLFKVTMYRHRKKQLVLLLKASAFTVISTAMTFLIAFFITHDANVSMSVSAIDIASKVVLYYVFDVSWTKLVNHF